MQVGLPLPFECPKVGTGIFDTGAPLTVPLTLQPEQMTPEQLKGLLAAVVTSSEDPIITKTLEGVVTSWNASAERVFGYSAAEMVGQSIRKIIPEDRQHEEEMILSRIAAGEHLAHFETVRLARDGRMLEISVSISPLVDADGKIFGVSKIVRDIGDRKQYERQIAALSQEIAHRARNLLTVVQSIIRQTAAAGDPGTLLNRLLDRIGALGATYDLMGPDGTEGADLDSLLKSQLAHFGELIGSRIHIEGPTLQLTRVAAQNIGMSIHELSTNACKYGALSAEGDIHIAWRIEPGPTADFEIEWREAGGPAVIPPTRRGFGWRVTNLIAGASLGGRSETRYAPEGLSWTLSAPLANVTALSDTDALAS